MGILKHFGCDKVSGADCEQSVDAAIQNAKPHFSPGLICQGDLTIKRIGEAIAIQCTSMA
jgi:hypothetical protein